MFLCLYSGLTCCLSSVMVNMETGWRSGWEFELVYGGIFDFVHVDGGEFWLLTSLFGCERWGLCDYGWSWFANKRGFCWATYV